MYADNRRRRRFTNRPTNRTATPLPADYQGSSPSRSSPKAKRMSANNHELHGIINYTSETPWSVDMMRPQPHSCPHTRTRNRTHTGPYTCPYTCSHTCSHTHTHARCRVSLGQTTRCKPVPRRARGGREGEGRGEGPLSRRLTHPLYPQYQRPCNCCPSRPVPHSATPFTPVRSPCRTALSPAGTLR